MLTINKPEIVSSSTGVRLQAEFNRKGKSDVLWYEVDEKYKEYLTVERADAFLVGLSGMAIKEGYDITVNYSLSERLYYTLNKYLIPVIADTLKCKPIKVYCTHLTSVSIKSAHAVGTGLSCGIDSFSTIYEHLEDNCPKGYQVSHLTFFNVGSHGSYGGDKARELFNKRLHLVKQCAHELGKDLLVIDSNISELFEMEFAKMHTIRNMSAVLTMQKLFKSYYYSSSIHLRNFTLEKSMGSYDVFSLSMLSTENTDFISSGAFLTRVDKTRMIKDFKPARRHLNVCITDGMNCGGCIKCLRTLLTLELLGKLDEFNAIFNMHEYKKRRSRYIVSVLARHKSDNFMRELYEEMRKSRFKIPFHLKIMSGIAHIKVKLESVVNKG